jgi:hypothetical protein
MVEHPNRASSTLVRLRSIIGKKHAVRAIGIVLSALLFWGLSKYLILAGPGRHRSLCRSAVRVRCEAGGRMPLHRLHRDRESKTVPES